MDKEQLKVVLTKRLEDAEYWGSKKGYEQEAFDQILGILRLLISDIHQEIEKEYPPAPPTVEYR